MPFIKRDVQPVNLSRGDIPRGVTQELECVTNSTLANIIRQLSGLSKHAEDLFGELSNEANKFFDRACSLQDRIDKLKVKVTQLDSTVEEVSLQDINQRKPFRSSQKSDQQVMSRNTMPAAMLATYRLCEKPPPLEKVNQFREDGKDSMKVYTDPEYFFNLWYEQLKKDAEKQKDNRRKKKRPGNKNSRKHKVREVKKQHNWDGMKYGAELAPNSRTIEKTGFQSPHTQQQQQHHNHRHRGDHQQQERPGSLEIDTNVEYTMTQSNQNNSNVYQNGPVIRRSASQEGNTNVSPYDSTYNDYHNVQPADPRQSRVSRNQSMYSRPAQPPPPPPPIANSPMSSPGSQMLRGSRQDLPAPPPPPPMPIQGAAQHQMAGQYTPSPSSSPSKSQYSSASDRGSPAHEYNRASPSHTPDSNDLPPPPPPPPLSPDSLKGPNLPPPPPPIPENFNNNIPVPPPPPPPMLNGGIHYRKAEPPPSDNVSMSSDTSSMTNASSEPAPPPIAHKAEPERDGRSDLLSAIRQGVQLKKRQEQEEKDRNRHRDSNKALDVQTIMDRAFEMRRRAMEDTDDEDDDDDDDDDEGWDE